MNEEPLWPALDHVGPFVASIDGADIYGPRWSDAVSTNCMTLRWAPNSSAGISLRPDARGLTARRLCAPAAIAFADNILRLHQ